jgi:Uncharacterized protein conserved in bacteria
MKLLIDADGCPVVDICIKICGQYNIECLIICDTAHEFNRDGAKTVIVEKGADSVDFKLVNMIAKGDIVVTQDYGLAAMCLARSAVVLNQDGMVYNENNIDSLLNSRHVAKKIRLAGGRLSGPNKRKPEQNDNFMLRLKSIINSR